MGQQSTGHITGSACDGVGVKGPIPKCAVVTGGAFGVQHCQWAELEAQLCIIKAGVLHEWERSTEQNEAIRPLLQIYLDECRWPDFDQIGTVIDGAGLNGPVANGKKQAITSQALQRMGVIKASPMDSAAPRLERPSCWSRRWPPSAARVE